MNLFSMPIEQLESLIEKALYQADPGLTDCCLNEGMEGEYAQEAAKIANLFRREGYTLNKAAYDTFRDQFDGAFSEERLDLAIRDLMALKNLAS